MSNKYRTVLYIGYTNDLNKRVKLHKSGNGANFTKKYNVFDLVYFEVYDDDLLARKREKQLKNWHKEWKWNLVRETNPELKTIEINLIP